MNHMAFQHILKWDSGAEVCPKQMELQICLEAGLK